MEADTGADMAVGDMVGMVAEDMWLVGEGAVMRRMAVVGVRSPRGVEVMHGTGAVVAAWQFGAEGRTAAVVRSPLAVAEGAGLPFGVAAVQGIGAVESR